MLLVETSVCTQTIELIRIATNAVLQFHICINRVIYSLDYTDHAPNYHKQDALWSTDTSLRTVRTNSLTRCLFLSSMTLTSKMPRPQGLLPPCDVGALDSTTVSFWALRTKLNASVWVVSTRYELDVITESTILSAELATSLLTLSTEASARDTPFTAKITSSGRTWALCAGLWFSTACDENRCWEGIVVCAVERV